MSDNFEKRSIRELSEYLDISESEAKGLHDKICDEMREKREECLKEVLEIHNLNPDVFRFTLLSAKWNT